MDCSSFSRFTAEHQLFFLGKAGFLLRENGFQFAQTVDRKGNGFPVGQHTAEPAVIDVVLSGAFCGFAATFVLSLTFGANEQNAATIGDDVAHGAQGLLQQTEQFVANQGYVRRS
jgi:hypothetical protein